MYRLMLYYLLMLVSVAVVLSLFKVLPFNPLTILSNGFFFLFICFISNQGLARLFQTKTNVESQFITALILTLIFGPVPLVENLGILIFVGSIAMASKYLLVFKKRHILNPAAFAVVSSAILFNQGASWWVGHPGLLVPVIVGGLLIIAKLRRSHLVLGFLVTHLLLLWGFGPPIGAAIFFSPLLFFSFVMLVEPLTAPQGKRLQIFFGVVIAVFLCALQKFAGTIPYSLELSLVLGNFVFFLIQPYFRFTLTLKEKQNLDTNIYGFWFVPETTIGFVAGQYFEWTLPHSPSDSRGYRRFFTIASAPSESQVLLTTKFSKPSSTFKSKLLAMKPGEKISISQKAGDFILPRDPNSSLCWIAGGIGITPFRSMTKDLIDRGEKRDIILLYSVKNLKDIVFREIFTEATRLFSFRVVYISSDQEGYIDGSRIKSEVPDWKKRHFYLSGPEPMVIAFSKLLKQIGVRNKMIERDFFPGYSETYQV